MKHYIDALVNASNDAQRRQITRDQLGLQESHGISFIDSALIGFLIGTAFNALSTMFSNTDAGRGRNDVY